VRGLSVLAVLAGLLMAVGCGGGSSSGGGGNPPPPTVNNVAPISVNSGILNDYANGVFVSVMVCVPVTSNCQTIDNILLDTGSFGLRLLASGSAGGALTLALPQENDSTTGNPIAECTQFADTSFLWGPVRMADVKIAGESASNVPINVAGDPAFTNIPTSCSSGGTNHSTLQGLGANGILGVGLFAEDCGFGCASGGNPAPPPGVYYTCPTATCVSSFVSIAQQVTNPVALFATDNNGVIVELPSVSASGATSVNGSLIFGIGTHSNNGLGTAKIFAADPSTGNFTTVFKNASYTLSFIDSGSNGLFFSDPTTTGIPACTGTLSPWYCPASTQSLTATQQGFGGTGSGSVSFSIASASSLFSSPTNAVFNDLGGPNPGAFDWGLPFFLGRNVYVAIDGKSTPGGTGPYWAY
jgi:hypothetical protein